MVKENSFVVEVADWKDLTIYGSTRAVAVIQTFE